MMKIFILLLFPFFGMVTQTQAQNNALNFDGADDVVNCGNNANLKISTGTIEAWVKSSGGGSSWRGIIIKQMAYGLFLKDNVLVTHDWSVGLDRSTGINLADNQWHHVAMSFQSGVANGTKIYIDGNLALTTSITVNNQNEPLLIGGGGIGISQIINGSIDAVRIWNVVRTQAEIQATRDAELSSGTGLIAAYNFNQGTANGTNTGITTLNDAVGSNNGTLQNFALTGTTSNWVSGFCTTPSVSIALTSGTNPNCSGSSITFTATPTNGGTSPTYQWKKNGNNVGTNSTTYSDDGTTSGNISCVMTVGTDICPTSPTATSAIINLINTPLNAILATTNGNCLISNNLTLSGASSAAQIQWQQNGAIVSTVGLSYANTGTTVVGTGVEGSAANLINHPTGVFVDASGNIYVTDYSNYRIQKWAVGATSGVTVAGGNGKGTAANQFFDPHGLFVDGAGTIYVSDGDAHRIQKWVVGATTGVTVAGGNGRGSAANQFNAVTDVFVDASGNIYASDALNHRVQRWAAGANTGTTVAGTGGAGSAANQLNFPSAIFLDGSGNLYIADFTNERIQKWAVGASSGTTVAGGNGNGSAANQFKGPSGIYVDAIGNIYVADAHNRRIQRFAGGSTTGVTVAGGNGQGAAANQFNNAYDVYLDNNLNLYVADYENSRIQKWATTGISINYTPSVSGTYTAVVSNSNGCSTTTNSITINPISTPSVSIAQTSGTNPNCAGTAVIFTATPTNGGTNPSFQWKKDGNNVGTNSPTYTDATATSGTISCVMTVGTGICTDAASATSSGTTLVVNNCTLKLSAKVFIQGAYQTSTGFMNDGLRSTGKIPTSQPYNTLTFNGSTAYSGSETVLQAVLDVTGNDAIVDWVLIELRDAANPSNIPANGRRAALLQRDGDIVDINGTSVVSFPSLAEGDYHVIVRHRLCLATRTNTAVTFSYSNTPSVNFTNSSNTLSGSQKLLTTGVYGLYIGDADRSGVIAAGDVSSTRSRNPTIPTTFIYNLGYDLDFNASIFSTDVLIVRGNTTLSQVNLNQ